MALSNKFLHTDRGSDVLINNHGKPKASLLQKKNLILSPGSPSREQILELRKGCLTIEGATNTDRDEWSVSIPTVKNGVLEVQYARPESEFGRSEDDITLYRDGRSVIAGYAQSSRAKRWEKLKERKDAWSTFDKIFKLFLDNRAQDVRSLEIGLGLGGGVFRLVDAGVPHQNIHVIDHDPAMFELATKCAGAPLGKENFHAGDAVQVVLHLAQAKPQKQFDFIAFDAFEKACHISVSVKAHIEQFAKALVQITSPGGVAVFNACWKDEQWNLATTIEAYFEQMGATCFEEQKLGDANRLMTCKKHPLEHKIHIGVTVDVQWAPR